MNPSLELLKMKWKIYDQSEKLSVVDHMFAPKMIELPETFGKIDYRIP